MTQIRNERDTLAKQKKLSRGQQKTLQSLNELLTETTRKYRASLKSTATKRPQRVQRAQRTQKREDNAALVEAFFKKQPRTKLQQLRDARDAERSPAKRAQLDLMLRNYTKVYRFMIEQRDALSA